MQNSPYDANKKNWRFMLYAMKVEIALYDFKQSLFWQSAIEITIMGAAFVALLVSHFFLFFIHLVHVLRPYVARRIILKLPKTHEILETMPGNTEGAQEFAHQFIVNQFQSASTFYSHYFILSCAGAVFDSLGLLYTLINMGNSANVYMFYLNVAIVFLMFDFYIILFSKSLIFSVPSNLWSISKMIVISREKDTFDMVNGFMNELVRGK